MHGEVSGTVIDPFFIYAAQCLGMHFCEGVSNSPALILLKAKYVQRCVELVGDLSKGHDWELRAQVALWITAVGIILSNNRLAPLYIQKACEAIDTAGLQFIPTYGRPPAFSDELHEKLSVLSQIIYFENFLFLTCGGAEPTMTVKIEKEFRHRLQVRSAHSSSFTSRVQRFPIGSLPGIIQHLSADNADANHSTSQRHRDHAQPLPCRW